MTKKAKAKYKDLIESGGPPRNSPNRLDAILRPSKKRHGTYPNVGAHPARPRGQSPALEIAREPKSKR
jgi:hypothetical protein